MKLPVLHMASLSSTSSTIDLQNQEINPSPRSSSPFPSSSPAKSMDAAPVRRTKRKNPALICCGVVVAVLIVLAIIFVALYFTLFRPRSPKVVATVVGTEISAFNLFPTVFNLTVHVSVTVHNPNYAAFRYGDVVTVVRYHGDGVGQAVVRAGEIGARATETVAATVEVDTVRVAATPFLLPEAILGVLPFETATAVAGKAVVLSRFKISARSEVACEVHVFWLRGNATSECTSTVHVGR